MYDPYYDDNTEQVCLNHWTWTAKKKRLEAVNVEWMKIHFKTVKKVREDRETRKVLADLPTDYFSCLVGWQTPEEDRFAHKRHRINLLCAEMMGVSNFKEMPK